MILRSFAASAAFAVVLVPLRVYAAAGDLDVTFGNQGRQAFGSYTLGGDIALQSDGKIVIEYYFGGWYVARYDTNGALDLTFGTGGSSANAFPTITATPEAIAVQPDDYIVVAGIANGGTPDMDFAVSRFEPDGDLDPTFGSGGVVITPFGPGIDRARDVAILPDGKIVVVGDAEIGGEEDFAVARYDSNGNLDPGFGSGGLVTTDVGDDINILLAVAADNGGRIVAAGINGIIGYYMKVVRYEDDGDLDPTFGTGGIVDNPYATGSQPEAIVVQPDDRIVVGGSADFRLAVARFEDNGALDTSFGEGGTRVLHELQFLSYARGLALQPNGSIVGAGYRVVDNTADFVVVRFLANGSADPTFKGGFTSTDFALLDDNAYGVALQQDGNIVVGGNVYAGPNDPRIGLARYEGTGPCEPGPAPDADADFLCDAADPCFNPAGARDFTAEAAATIKLIHVDDGIAGNDAFRATASFDLPSPGDFAAFDPLSNGARLILARRSGSVVLDLQLSATAFAGGDTAGWIQKSEKLWRYVDHSAAALEGIVRVDVAARPTVPGRVRVKVTARHGTYAIKAQQLPLALTAVLGDTAASAAGRCGEGNLAAN